MTTGVVSDGGHISRARRYQLRHKQAGLCMLCPVPAVTKKYCAKHAVAARERQRTRMKFKRRNLGAASYSFDKKKSVEDAAIADVCDAINRNDTDAMKKTYDDLQNKFQEISAEFYKQASAAGARPSFEDKQLIAKAPRLSWAGWGVSPALPTSGDQSAA